MEPVSVGQMSPLSMVLSLHGNIYISIPPTLLLHPWTMALTQPMLSLPDQMPMSLLCLV